MSDSVEQSFDVEAQEALLPETPAPAAESSNARKTLLKFILLIRSTELFKLGAADDEEETNTLKSYEDDDSDDVEALLETPAPAADQTSHARETLLKYILLIRSTQLFQLGAVVDILSQEQGSEIVEEVSTGEDVSSVDPAAPDGNSEPTNIQRKNALEIVRKRDLQELQDYGGVEQVAKALNTHLQNGISTPQQTCLRKPSQISRFLSTVLKSFVEAFNNITVFLLLCAAAFSLWFGIKEDGLHLGWFNGAVLFTTILFILVGTTIRNCWEVWSSKELGTKGRMYVQVVRGGGHIQLVKEIDLQVGDVALVQKGHHVPADGLFISGQGLQLDEGFINPTLVDKNSPFLFYGSRVINGKGRMLVTSTLMDTMWGEMMSQTTAETESKFESYLHKLNTCVQIVGLLISILIIIVLFLRYKAGKLDDERRFRPDPRGEPTQARTIMDAIKGIVLGSKGTARVLMTLLSVSLVGIVEGIPFSIAMAAILWNSKTMGDKASERHCFASVKMASVTAIVADKFGGITENDKEIDMFCIGEEFVTESSVVASQVIEGVCDGIGTMLLLPPSDAEAELLPHISWAEKKLGMQRDCVIARCKMMRCNSGRNPFEKTCRVLMEKDDKGGYLHCIGRPDDVLSMCSHCYDIDGREHKIDEEKLKKLKKAVSHMLIEPSAQVIAYACKCVKDFEHETLFEPNDLILLAMISIKDTRMEETQGAVSTLKEAEIMTILASIENVDALKRIGQKCGLINGIDDLVLTAEEFREWSDEERANKVEKVRILGNCIPSDKILVIKSLQERGKVVATLGQRTMDAPCLKQADIGITYGSWSSQVARECCEISIWRGNCLSFMVKVISNGRCFEENIRKCIQLQLILAISSSLINFIAVVFWGDAPITAVQLFWLNLVVGVVGGLALLTGPSTTTLMQHNSSGKQLITKAMWRNIALQVSYQTTVFITLQHKGQAILDTNRGRVKLFIYNGFFVCQMFNKFIAREPERKNIFRGLLRAWFWMGWVIIFIICQGVFAMVEEVLETSPGLSYKLWGVCVLIGLVSWFVDWIGKMASNCKISFVFSSSPFNQSAA